MGQCELCGRSSETLKNVRVEGVEMNCCPVCAKSGVEVKNYVFEKPQRRSFKREIKNEYEFIVPNAGALIKAKREQMNMKQIDLSRRLNIKESIIHQVESGSLKPTLDVAKKFEEGLGIFIISKQEVKKVNLEQTDTKGFTLGDFIKKRK